MDFLCEEVQKIERGNVGLLKLDPSGPDTAGFNCPFIKDFPLTKEESVALGLIEIGNQSIEIDLVLLDFASPLDSHQRMLRSVTSERGYPIFFDRIRESLIPYISKTEVNNFGISINRTRSYDPNQTPYARFLNEYMRGVINGKKILLFVGHGGLVDNGERVIGSYNDRSFDRTSYFLNNIDLSKNSCVLDDCCANSSYIPSQEINTNGATIFSPQSTVLFDGPSTNELQSSCTILGNNCLTEIDWSEIMHQRRVSGRLRSIHT
jgi:hypothetical protein